MKKIFLTLALISGILVTAQVKIGDNVTTLNANSLLELEATNKGVLFPRVALTGTTAFAPLSAHVAGMTVYNTATTGDVTPGMYTNSGSAWVKLVPSYQNITGKVTTIISSTYTVSASDYTIITNSDAGVTITLPSLTASEAGRIINIINNNTAALANTITSSSNAMPLGTGINQYRGRAYVWTGSIWLANSL
jgi:hypothetical protein